MYERVADSFRLYSKGRNKVDEDGQWEIKGPDDWCFWPPPAKLRQRVSDNRRSARAEDEAAESLPQPATDKSDEEMMKELAETYGDHYRMDKQADANDR